jgi:hypothetical protein
VPFIVRRLDVEASASGGHYCRGRPCIKRNDACDIAVVNEAVVGLDGGRCDGPSAVQVIAVETCGG